MLLPSLTFLLLFVNLGQSDEDNCETVRFLKRKLNLRCCQIDNNTIDDNFTSKIEEISINLDGVEFLCQHVNKSRDVEARVKVLRIVTPNSYKKTKLNETQSVKENGTTPILKNRNFGDVPGRCPDGMFLDSVGDCVEVWD